VGLAARSYGRKAMTKRKICRKLGDYGQFWAGKFPPKPRGMWRRTYARYCTALDASNGARPVFHEGRERHECSHWSIRPGSTKKAPTNCGRGSRRHSSTRLALSHLNMADSHQNFGFLFGSATRIAANIAKLHDFLAALSKMRFV
jgi:hypothetical protein